MVRPTLFNATRPLSQVVSKEILGGNATSAPILPGTQTPGWPGAKLGLNMEQVQALIAGSRKVKGYRVNCPANQIVNQDIDLSGTGKLLLGLVVIPVQNFANPSLTPRNITLMLNELQLINQLPFNLASKIYSTDADYLEFIQPLAGQDSITLTINNTGGGAQDVDVAFYYL